MKLSQLAVCYCQPYNYNHRNSSLLNTSFVLMRLRYVNLLIHEPLFTTTFSQSQSDCLQELLLLLHFLTNKAFRNNKAKRLKTERIVNYLVAIDVSAIFCSILLNVKQGIAKVLILQNLYIRRKQNELLNLMRILVMMIKT